MATSNTSIHWLTATIDRNEKLSPAAQVRQLAQAVERCTDLTPCKPQPRNYTDGLQSTLGTFSWHGARPDMKVCYNASGAPLDTAYDLDLPPLRLVMALHGNNAKFTRIDLALDYPGEVDIADIIRAAKAHPETTRARTLIPYDQVKLEGEIEHRTTGVYIGSTKSDRWITVYDKALEAGLPDILLTRIEARNRKRMAQRIADSLIGDSLPVVTRSVIRDFADFPLDWWQDALSGPVTSLPPVGRKVTDTARWLIEQIAPVVDREIRATGGMHSPVYQAFASVIAQNTHIDNT